MIYATLHGPVGICASKEEVTAPVALGKGTRTTEAIAPAVLSSSAAGPLWTAGKQVQVLIPLLVIADLSEGLRYNKAEAWEACVCTLDQHRVRLMSTVGACNKEGPAQKEDKARH